MKRYYLFAGEDAHPQGGVNDVKGHYNTIDDAKKAFVEFNIKAKIRQSTWWEWCQIVDSTTMQVVEGNK